MVKKTPIKVLMAEDNEDDYSLTREMLSRSKRCTFDLKWASNYEDALEALRAEPPDVVLVDYHLLQQNGIEFIRTARANGCQAPFIMLTGEDNPEVDLLALQAGAMDYLIKQEVTPGLLDRSIRYAIERHKLVEANRQQKELFQSIIDTEASGVAILSGPDLIYQLANPAYRLIMPHTDLDPIGKSYQDIWSPSEGFQQHLTLQQVRETGTGNKLEGVKHIFPDGTSHYITSHFQPILWNDEPAVLSVIWETTDLVQARYQAEQSAKEARRQAAEAEQGFRILKGLLEYIPEGITIADAPHEAIRMVSKYGMQLAAERAQPLEMNAHPERMARTQVFHTDGVTPAAPEELPISRAIRKGEVVINEEWIIRQDGAPDLIAHCNAGPIRDGDGKIIHGVLAWRDVSEQVLSHKLVEAEQSRLKAIIQNAPLGIVVADKECRILMTNPAADQIFARPIPYEQDYSSHAFLQLCYPDGTPYDPRQLPLTRSALDGETLLNVEIGIFWPDGQMRSLRANCAPILDPYGNIDGAVGVFQDMTEIKKVEAEVVRSTAQIEVQRHLIEQRELERLKIAQDLHDGPLQELIAVSYGIANLRGMVSDNREAGESLQAISTILHDQIREVRAYCNELRPPALAPFGLEKAIRSHAETFSNLHPELFLNLDLAADQQALPSMVRLVLFRIYQELLHNIAKHARAKQVIIRFSLDNRQALLEISDDGTGFQVPSQMLDLTRQGHLGLAGVEERANSIGGRAIIHSMPGKGTVVEVKVPILENGSILAQ